jgi:hypothetical protein
MHLLAALTSRFATYHMCRFPHLSRFARVAHVLLVKHWSNVRMHETDGSQAKWGEDKHRKAIMEPDGEPAAAETNCHAAMLDSMGYSKYVRTNCPHAIPRRVHPLSNLF